MSKLPSIETIGELLKAFDANGELHGEVQFREVPEGGNCNAGRRLLEYAKEHAGQPLTRGRLMELINRVISAHRLSFARVLRLTLADFRERLLVDDREAARQRLLSKTLQKAGATNRPRRVRKPPDRTGQTLQEPVIQVGKWSDLGIGIAEDGEYLAITPCPEYGEVFPKKKSVALRLPGRQWQELLKLLAQSKHGNTADKRELMRSFGYAPGSITDRRLAELKESPRSMQMLRRARTRLTGVIGDLGRKLRRQVEAKSPGKVAVLSVAKEQVVEAAFTVRYVKRDMAGKLRFGSADG